MADSELDLLLFRRGLVMGRVISGRGSQKRKLQTPTTQTTNTAFTSNLSSNSVARVLHLISEGPIVGLVGGAKGIYFDDTVLENPDGSRNFQGVTYSERLGEPDQAFIPGFAAVEDEVSVNSPLDFGSPVTRTITDDTVTRIRIKIRVPALYSTNPSTGVIGDSQVFTVVDVRPFGGSYTTYINDQILGRTNTAYEKDLVLTLPEGGAPWDIRVTRGNAVENTQFHQNASIWASYTKITDARLSYPDSALVGITFNRQQFQNEIPTVSFDIKGMIIKVPSNYNPETREYTGIWNGSFTEAWTNNPAWVLYDMCINNRYGLGDFLSQSNLDKFDFYEFAQYNDELVPDGKGGTEPRFTFNGVLQTAQDAIDVLNAIASNFRAMLYWRSGGVTVVQDSPKDVKQIVAPANVEGGKFNYSSQALSASHSVANISWNDPEDNYRLSIAVYEDRELIRKLGYKKSDIAAIGVTSQSQALRLGKNIIETERVSTDTVSYSAGWDHFDTGSGGVIPGDIVAVMDPKIVSVRKEGRLLGYSGNVINLDKQLTMTGGGTARIAIQNNDATLSYYNVVSSSTTTINGNTVSQLTLDAPVDAGSGDGIPSQMAIWMEVSEVEPRQFRIISVREVEPHKVEVTGLYHDPTKYDRIESNIVVDPPNFTLFPTGPLGPPTSLAFSESLYQSQAGVKSAILISWTLSTDSRAFRYEVWVQDPSDLDYRLLGTTSQSNFTLFDNITGTYLVKVRAVDGLGGQKSVFLEGTYEAGGLAVPPSDVENFTINTVGANSYLSWDAIGDLDLAYYQIRFTPNLLTPTWGSSSILINQVSANTTSITVPTMIGSFSIKAFDTSGSESANATFILTDIDTIQGLNVVETVIEDPLFLGEKVDTVVNAGLLKLKPLVSVDDYEDVDYVDNFDIGDGPEPVDNGYYYIQTPIDLGASFTSRITPATLAYGENLLELVDTWADVDAVSNWDGAEESDWLVQLEINTTAGNPLDTDSTWDGWRNCTIGDYTARGYDFRWYLQSNRQGVTPVVEEARIAIDMEDRVIEGHDITCPAAGMTVTFSPGFKAIPGIAVSAQDMATGDYVVKSSITETGFFVRFFNSGGIGVERTFDYIAKGYGYQS